MMNGRELILNDYDGNDDEGLVDSKTSSRIGMFLDNLWDPGSRAHRYLAFMLMNSIGFFSFFGTCLPGALQIQFMDDLGLSATEFSLFTSITSWCNVVLCLCGGALIDKTFGLRAGNMLFCIVMIVGQVVFALGAYQKSLVILIIGRLIFSAGGDVLLITQKAFAAKWFPANEQNFVFGLLGSVNLLAATISQLIMVPIYDSISVHVKKEKCLGGTMLATVALLVPAAVASLLIWYLDLRRDKILKIDKRETSEAIDTPKLIDIIRFPIPIWLLSIISTFTWGSLSAFLALAKPLLMKKYDLSVYDTSIQMSLFFIATVIFSPIFGALINRLGQNMSFIVVSSVSLLVCNLLLAFTFLYPSIVHVAMGVSISIINAALFSAFPNLVKTNQLASAFGLVQSMINFGLAMFSLLGGVIIDQYGYFALCVYFYFLSLGGLVVTFVAFFYDKLTNGKLNLSRKAQDAIQKIN